MSRAFPRIGNPETLCSSPRPFNGSAGFSILQDIQAQSRIAKYRVGRESPSPPNIVCKPISSEDNVSEVSRRSFLAMTGAAVMLTTEAAAKPKSLPAGLELYSVRDELAKDLMGTV